jgi:anthranilate phosphoribosyltransferase
VLGQLTEQLQQRNSLANEQVRDAVSCLVDENLSAEIKADFLTALSQKGETVEELAAFARELRDMSIQPPLDAELRSCDILDVCGTGGDHLNTFNISTTVALVAASAGIAVAKHGNRAVTSQSGSADVLEALGIRIDLPMEKAVEGLKRHNFAFFFAPKFHPAFKHLSLARKMCAQRNQRTIFNLLGPLLNPARPTAQLIGVPRPEFCEPMARVLQMLGIRRGMVACGEVRSSGNNESASAISSSVFLDEFSTLGENVVAEFYQERGLNISTLSPENFPIRMATLKDLAGADAKTNAQIVRRIFSGEESGAKLDAVLLNSAAALLVGGKARNLCDGWDLAAKLIADGKAQKTLDELVEFSQSAASA